MNRLEMYHYLEKQRREISDAEDALAEEQARLDKRKRELAESRRIHHNTVLSQLGYICTELPEQTSRTPKGETA